MSEQFGDHLADMLLADGATTAPSVAGELARERFEGEDRRIRQVESRWVPGSGPFDTGHWEEVEVTDVGPAPT
jgi:hypothetical protein